MIDYARIVALGKRATARPWHWWTSNSMRRLGSDNRDGNVAYGQRHPTDHTNDIAISQRDMDYSEAAANSADVMAQQLLDIGKLCEDHAKRNSGLIGVSELRAILERQAQPAK